MPAIDLKTYATRLFGEEDAALAKLCAEATGRGIPGIQIPPELGQLLQMLAVQLRAKRILEIGTLFGYSAILMAQVLSKDGRLVTLEAEPLHAGIARENIARAGWADRVTVMEGRAIDLLATLTGETFDLVFIDADKKSYPEYLDWTTRLTRPGSVIVADNIWRNGSVVDPSRDDEDAQGAARFNEMVAADSRLISSVVPRFDGSDAAMISVVREAPSPSQ